MTSNLVWKRNRNNYVKLISLVCECEIVVDPFHSLPPEADLPKLSRHRINSIIDAVEREVKNGSKKSKQSSSNSRDGECTGSHSLKSKDCLYQEAGISSAQEEGESSFLMDQFAHTEELNYDSISFDVKNGLFFSAGESTKSMSTSKKMHL